MNKHKRLLSFVLAVAMVLGMFPLTAHAEDETAHIHCEVCDSHEHTTENHPAEPQVCEICKGEDGKHSTACPTLCECDPEPAEGEAHAVGCPLNLTPVTTASLDGETTNGTTVTTTTSGTTDGTTTSGTTDGTTAATTTPDTTGGTTEGGPTATTVATETTAATTQATTAPTTVPTTAPTTVPTTAPTEATTVPTTEATTEVTTAPTTEATTEATTESTTESTVVLCEVCGVDPCVCELESVYLMKGASIYKDYTDAAETPKVIEKWNTEISIKETITADDGTIWYNFAYTSFWAELFNGYHYVRMDDTTEYQCSCETETDVHGEECALCTDEIAVYVYEKSAEEIHADWDNLDAETQNAVLEYLSKNDIDKFAALQELRSEHKSDALPIEDSVYAVQFSGGSGLQVEVASAEVAHALQYAPATTSRTKYAWRGVYDITANAGTQITMTDLPTFTSEAIEIRHYLDNSAAITSAIAAGKAKYLSVEGFESYFSDEIAALQAVNSGSDGSTICYTMISSDDGDVEIIGLDGGSRAVSFYADSYSYYEVSIAHKPATNYTNAAAPVEEEAPRSTFSLRASKVDNPGIETSKTVIYDEGLGEFKLRLESYVTGSTITSEISTVKPTDFVISIDISHSMPPCINCGAGSVDATGTGLHQATSKCKVYPDDLDYDAVYYRSTNETNPLYYCYDCEDWYSEKHTADSHGGQVYVCAYPNGTDYTAQFYSQSANSNCGDSCTHTDWKHPIYADELDITQKYTKSSGSSKAENLLVYCVDCGFWYPSNDADHAPRDTHESDIYHPFKIANDPRNNKDIQFYKRCVSRMEAAKDAAAAFVAMVKEKSKGVDGVAGTEDDVPHRVAVIGFGGNGTGDGKVGVADYQTISSRAKSKYTSTGIYSLYEDKVDSGFGYYNSTASYNNFESYHIIKSDAALAASCYENALRDVTNSTEFAVLEEGIQELNYNYGTYINFAAIMTEQIFEATYVEDEQGGISRNRVAVFFTDGQPDGDTTGTYDLADESIQPAYRMKNSENYNATVYSIGIFAAADASKIWHLTDDNANQDEYMHMLSSNYPTAYKFEGGRKVRDVGSTTNRNIVITDVNQSLLTTDANGNTIVDTSKGGYYLTANNASSLVNAFENIAKENTTGGANESAKKLDEKTVLQDIVSQNFTIDIGEDTTREIKVWTESYTGDKLWTVDETVDENIKFTVDKENNIVQVTGFNYSENYVGTDTAADDSVTYRGKKIVVEIPIAVPDSNMGGVAMETNNSTNSGIFYNKEIQEQFDLPHVDIPRTITISKEVIGGSTTAFNYELSYEPFRDYAAGGNDGSSGNYLYVDEADPEDQMGIASMSITADNPATSDVVEGKRTIENMMPGTDIRITEQNVANYMVAVSLDGGNTWKDLDGNIWSEAPEEPEEPGEPEEPEGEEGSDGGEETPEESEVLEVPCTLVMDNDGNCTVTISGWEWPSGMDIVFRNTLRVVDLTINKEIKGETNPDQSFLFQIDGEDVSIPVVIPAEDFVDGTASVTIKELKVGMYTVTEDSGWSWRYALDSVETDEHTEVTYKLVKNGIQFIMDHEGSTVTFTNKRTEDKWLDGESHAANIFAGVASTTPATPNE